MLRYIIFFSTLLMMAVTVRAQCEKPVIGGNRIMTEGSQQETFSEGSTVKFNCYTGYVPERRAVSSSITCMGTQWSELELQCKKKSCGNPGEITNGKYKYQPTDAVLFGAVVTAVCNKGYQLAGYGIRNCRENGWGGRPPVCEVVKCKRPPDVTDGTFEPDKKHYAYEEVVTYSCKRGLNLIGSSVLTCSDEGHFQPDPPQCLLVTCEKPEILNAVRIEGKSPPYKYREFVRYRCNEGYKMEGSDQMICTEKGWDPPPPQCTIITCVNPPIITNGHFTPKKEFYEYEQKVTYSCDEGFKLKGTSSISCTLQETFEPLLSQCLAVTCDPPSIDHGVVNVSLPSYKYNDQVHISCKEGFKIDGSNILTCKNQGWSPPLPRCIVVKCQPPPDVTDGTFKPDKEQYAYGDKVTYSCKRGLNLNGSSVLTCSDKGNFQPDPPQCLNTTCDAPHIINGFIIGDESTFYRYNSSVRVECNSLYKMEGSDNLTCEENRWNPPSPKCHFNHLVWIIPVTLLALISCAAHCYMKYRKPKDSKVLSNPVNSTLVSMQTKVPSTEEASPRSVPESIVLSHLLIED